MNALLWGLIAFATMLLAHLVVWRVRRPQGQYAGLAIVTLLILLAFQTGFYWFSSDDVHTTWMLPSGNADYVAFAFLYTTLSLAYIAFYPCVQADSPSLSMLLIVDEAGEKGVRREELEARLTDAELILPRVQDLLTGRLARQVGSRYVIEPRGALSARTHVLYRSLMKLGRGG